jgi:hypothetical protein
MPPVFRLRILQLLTLTACLTFPGIISATPANRAALAKHFDKFLTPALNKCTTCHLPSDNKNPESLDEFPHNAFGTRLRTVGRELAAAGKKHDIPARLAVIAQEDSDGDKVSNLMELLLGHSPGDANDQPGENELVAAGKRQSEFEKFLASYRWQPFESIKRPEIPRVKNGKWVRNPIDAFIAVEHEARKLKPRPEASRQVLLRRIYLDLLGLSPTPQELRDFEKDKSPMAYEKVVDRLLADPRYGERWGRHWMDVWRYSDWAGYNQEVRDSQPHIWRWRDWIMDSLNEDKGYDQMVQEMLAADELYPENTNALRATGFLVRNYKLLSREQWLADTVQHTSKAFLGLTMNCAKCHDHKYDPITQAEYYQMRAIFEPHFVRTDRVPEEHDTTKNGLVRTFDVGTNTPTYILVRGDERTPDTNRLIMPGIPAVLGGTLKIEPVKLPRYAAYPDKRDFAEQGAVAASEKTVAPLRAALEKVKADPKSTDEKRAEAEFQLALAEARHRSLLATLQAEKLADAGKNGSNEWNKAATEAVGRQRDVAVLEAKQQVKEARGKEQVAKEKAESKAREAETADKAGKDANEIAVKKVAVDKAEDDLKKAKTETEAAEKILVAAEKENIAPLNTAYKPSSKEVYPETSTGRRSAFARWLTDPGNPLTARVAMNHIWLRHFGQPLVSSTSNFGRSGHDPVNPQLLDWLAAELMAQNWSMKKLHRLIVTSSTYRMASTRDQVDEKVDRENIYLWRMPSKRMEAEAVRDNVLYIGGDLDSTRGGAEIPSAQGLTSKRRSIYLQSAAERQVKFMQIFDGPDVTECYERTISVMPQQALALANSELVLAESRSLAKQIYLRAGADEQAFVRELFLRVLAREPRRAEIRECVDFLKQQSKWLVTQLASAGGAPKSGATNAVAAPISEVGKARPGSNTTKVVSLSALRAREDLVLVLFNHNDFVTIR